MPATPDLSAFMVSVPERAPAWSVVLVTILDRCLKWEIGNSII